MCVPATKVVAAAVALEPSKIKNRLMRSGRSEEPEPVSSITWHWDRDAVDNHIIGSLDEPPQEYPTGLRFG
jgi:hypothetical protein